MQVLYSIVDCAAGARVPPRWPWRMDTWAVDFEAAYNVTSLLCLPRGTCLVCRATKAPCVPEQIRCARKQGLRNKGAATTGLLGPRELSSGSSLGLGGLRGLLALLFLQLTGGGGSCWLPLEGVSRPPAFV